MGHYDDDRYRDEEGEFIFNPEMPDEHGDEEWHAQAEHSPSPVRKRLKKARSSDDDQVQQSPKRSKSKHAGSKKRKPSKPAAAEMEEMWKYAARQDMENDDECDLPLLSGDDAAPGRYQAPQPDIPVQVERFIAQLEVVAEEDAELNRQSMPAINKLKLLPTLCQVMAKRPLQAEFLDRGILSVLKNWLEPLPDQSLPNSTLRTALLNILAKLPIDTGDSERREQLKNSGLGRVVKFLSRSEEETGANKRLAKALVDEWSRPLFQKPTRLNDVDLRHLNSERVNLKRARPQVSEGRSHGELESDDFDLEALQRQYAEESKTREAAGAMTERPEAMATDFVFRPPSKIDGDDVRARAKLCRKESNDSRGRLQRMMKKHTPKKKPQGFKPVAT